MQKEIINLKHPPQMSWRANLSKCQIIIKTTPSSYIYKVYKKKREKEKMAAQEREKKNI